MEFLKQPFHRCSLEQLLYANAVAAATGLKEAASSAIADAANKLEDVASKIWENPELNFEEVRAKTHNRTVARARASAHTQAHAHQLCLLQLYIEFDLTARFTGVLSRPAH